MGGLGALGLGVGAANKSVTALVDADPSFRSKKAAETANDI